MRIIQEIKKFLAKTPNEISQVNRPAYYLCLYGSISACLLHAFWMAFFGIYNVHALLYTNIASVIFWIFGIFYIRFKGMIEAICILSGIEVLISPSVGIYEMGWGYGFQYLYFTIPIFLFLVISKRFYIPVIIVALTMVVYILLYSSYAHKVPLVVLTPQIENMFTFINTSTTLLFLTAFSLIFSRIAYISHREVEKEKASALENLTQANKLVSIVTHDIDNAIFICSSAAKIIKQKQLFNEQGQKFLERIDFGVNIATEIIQSVKVMKAIKDGKQKLEIKPTNLKEILRKTNETFLEKLAAKNIELKILSQEEQLFAMVEPISFANNVLNNLVSNAIKFSYPDSQIIIDAKRDSQKIILTIKDSGIGIPDSIVQNMFNFSGKTNRQGTKGEPGTGYGMPVVKTFLDFYNSTIKVQSIPETQDTNNHGTIFTLVLHSA